MTIRETDCFSYADKNYTVKRYLDPHVFMAEFCNLLEKYETENNLVLGLSHCPSSIQARYPDLYYLALFEENRLCSLAMRTPPHNLLIAQIGATTDFMKPLAFYLAHKLEKLPGVLAQEDHARVFADIYAEEKSVEADIHMEQFIHELKTVNPDVAIAPGKLEQAGSNSIPLLLQWMNEFQMEALQTSLTGEHQQRVLEDIQDGQFYLWIKADGTPVSMVQKTRPTRKAYCLSYVYTPVHERSKGFARSAVSSLSKELLKTNSRCVLFTDKSNPTSNALYHHIGYRVCCALSLYTFTLCNSV